MELETFDPTTGQRIETYAALSIEAALERAERAAQAQRAWARTSFAERAALLRRVAEVLRGAQSRLAELMALEMGKPLREGAAEVEKCARVCEYYAEHGAEHLADRVVATGASKSYVTHRPLGVVLAIMPWNFPLWQVLRFVAPALMAGNGALIKHAPNVCGCSRAIEELLSSAGAPQGLVVSLLADVDIVEPLLASPHVQAATLTGSTRAGRAVAEQAGARLKPIVLELGGSDPYVVLADADLELTVEACAVGRLINAGQSCIAAKRIVVVDELHDAFVDAFEARLRSERVGDPRDPETTIGPLARADLRVTLHAQVERSIAAGARPVLGCTLPDGPGYFYPVSLLVDVGPGMPAYEEELFGPVACVLRARDEADALRIANASDYGLGAAVFTQDRERGERIARDELHAGACFVNAFVRSDPRLPFGGIKASGYGRELSAEGLLEFVNQKVVYVA